MDSLDDFIQQLSQCDDKLKQKALELEIRQILLEKEPDQLLQSKFRRASKLKIGYKISIHFYDLFSHGIKHLDR
jgi:hypothetical protein